MAPLPQAVAHACVFPDGSRQLGSLVQVFEQPDPSPKNRPFGPLQPVGNVTLLVPQSQPSLPSFTPLPQTDAAQVLLPPAAPVQVAPGSTRQIEEQPSPFVVLPSSHASLPIFMPSPHAGTHGVPGTRHS